MAVEVESRLPELEVLLKTSRGRMTADVIRQITEVPDIYRFQSYLALPNVQELQKSESSIAAVELLTLFSRGTFKLYKQNADKIPSLSEKQIFSLRCLSLASLARETSGQRIDFKTIQEELGFDDHWQVFDFLIEALNYGYVKGKMDEPAKLLYVEDYVTRDIEPDDRAYIRTKLSVFLSACDNTLERTKQESHRIDETKKQFDAERKELTSKLEKMKGGMDDEMSGDDPVRSNQLKDFLGGKNKPGAGGKSKGSAKTGGLTKMGRS